MSDLKVLGKSAEEKQLLFQHMIEQLQEFPNPHKRPQAATHKICEALELISFFCQNLQSEEQKKEALQEYSQYIKLEVLSPGEIIFKAGDKGDKFLNILNISRFYIVLRGSVDIYKPKENQQIQNQTLRRATENLPYNKLFFNEPEPTKVPRNFFKEAMQTLKPDAGTSQQNRRKGSLFIGTVMQAFQKNDNENENEEQIFQALHQKLTTIHFGGSFGELALTYNKPRFATARVSRSDNGKLNKKRRISFQFELLGQEQTILATLDKRSYHKISCVIEFPFIAFQNLEQQAESKANALKQVFPQLEQNTLIRLSYNLIQCVFPKNHFIYKEGQQSDCFYILQEGEVRLEKKKQRQIYNFFINISKQIKAGNYVSPLLLSQQKNSEYSSRPIALLQKGSILGLQELSTHQLRLYSALCLTEKVSLYRVNQNHYQEIIQEGAEGNFVLTELLQVENEFLQEQFKTSQFKMKKAVVKLFNAKSGTMILNIDLARYQFEGLIG